MRQKSSTLHASWLLLALAVVLGGCGNDEKTSCESGDCTSTASTSSCGEDCPALCGDGVCSPPDESAVSCAADCPACAPLADVGAFIESGELFFGYSVLGTAAESLECGALGDGKEVSVSLTPELSGELVLSTRHPSTQLDTVLEVREGSCDGSALGCSAEAPEGGPGSRLTVTVEAGTTYVALVETADDVAGVFALGLHRPGVCDGQGAAEDITAALLTGQRFAADTSTSTSSLRGGCSEAVDAPEVRYTFTAPEDGTLVATTVHPSTNFDTLLFARQGALDGTSYCDSVEAELACAVGGAPADAGTLLRFEVMADRSYDLLLDGAGSGAEGQATLTLGYATTSPSQERLQGCDYEGLQDALAFFVEAGQAVLAQVDTVDAATAADTRLRVRLPDGTELYEADDEVACTFPPPAYSCPQYGFTATTAGLYTVEVYVGSSESCADPSLVDYQLTVTVDGQASELIRIKDQ